MSKAISQRFLRISNSQAFFNRKGLRTLSDSDAVNLKSTEKPDEPKNVGIEKWAKEEAGDILDKYYYGTWTL